MVQIILVMSVILFGILVILFLTNPIFRHSLLYGDNDLVTIKKVELKSNITFDGKHFRQGDIVIIAEA